MDRWHRRLVRLRRPTTPGVNTNSTFAEIGGRGNLVKVGADKVFFFGRFGQAGPECGLFLCFAEDEDDTAICSMAFRCVPPEKVLHGTLSQSVLSWKGESYPARS
jgi:hypothetical protein